MQRRVVAVAAPIGGGKSTLVEALAVALGNPAGSALTLRFDDYENATQQSVKQLGLWVAAGADFNELEAPGLAADLGMLRKGGAIIANAGAPLATGTNSVATDVVFEMPLGREWAATASDIDVLVWIDVPLDIALARRLREISAGLLQRNHADMQQGLAWVNDYLAHYMETIHAVLEVQRRTVAAKADLVIDGRQNLDAMVRQVMKHLAAK